jgi:hypothetical protein
VVQAVAGVELLARILLAIKSMDKLELVGMEVGVVVARDRVLTSFL